MLRAVIVDANGENASDCVVHDVNAGGAQIGVSRTLEIGTDIYLLDKGNQLAYLAKVMWSKPDRCGLSFLHTHSVGPGLPPHLIFLWKLWLLAKLKEIDRNISNGAPARLAFLSAGLSEVDLHFMSQRAKDDAQFERVLTLAKRLWSAATERVET